MSRPIRLTKREFRKLFAASLPAALRESKRGSMRGCRSGGKTVVILNGELLDDAARRAGFTELRATPIVGT